MRGRRFKDYTDNKYHYLTALNLADPPRFKNKTWWTFRCDCGNVVDRDVSAVVAGSIKSCGCKNYPGKYNDLLGEKFHRLTAIKKGHPFKGEKGYQYIFKCDCGKSIDRYAFDVISGRIKSCGCLIADKNAIQNPIIGKKNRILSDLDFAEIEKQIKSGKSQKEAAKEWGISPSTILNYRRRKE